MTNHIYWLTRAKIPYLSRKKRGLLIRLRRWFYRNKNSSPYLSGDAFAALADYAPFGANGGAVPIPEKLFKANSIFVPSHLLTELVTKFGDQIEAKILITGNSDENFEVMPALPKSIELWLGQNLAVEVQEKVKVQSIPIGLENLALGRAGLPKFISSNTSLIEDRVLVPPMASSNQIRQKIISEIQNGNGFEIFDLFTDYLDERAYFKLANRYKFVLCLEGNGFENHRVWETLYRNSFPVMISTTWSLSLKSLGLPILYIDYPKGCTPGLLKDFAYKNSGFQAKFHETLWIDYWKLLVQGDRGEI